MTFISKSHSSRAALVAGILTLGFASGALASESGAVQPEGSAEPASPAAQAPPALQKLQSTQQKMQQLTGKLRELQAQATEANPELASERDAYRDLVIDTMSQKDFDAEAELQAMRELQTELRGGEALDDDQRQEKAVALEQKKQRFRVRQRQAMQSSKVRAARAELDQKMTAAMTEQDPEAGTLLTQLGELQKEYQQLLRQVMEQQQQSGDTPQG